MAMYPKYRTPERYAFIKGVIMDISDDHVAIQPYGEETERIVYVEPNVSEFWNGGLTYQMSRVGEPGDQGSVTTFLDNSGRPLVERLFINQEQVRGQVEGKRGNTLIVRQDGRIPHLQPVVVFSFHSDAQMFDETPVKLSEVQPGQLIAGIGEIKGPNHLDVALLDLR